ncbi:hypothetical protein ABPG74_022191 [Tetrahymena malaccensis]
MNIIIVNGSKASTQYGELNAQEQSDIEFNHFYGMKDRRSWVFNNKNFKKDVKEDDNLDDQSCFQYQDETQLSQFLKHNGVSKIEEDFQKDFKVQLKQRSFDDKSAQEKSKEVAAFNLLTDTQIGVLQKFQQQKQSKKRTCNSVDSNESSIDDQIDIKALQINKMKTRRQGLCNVQKKLIENNLFVKLGIKKAVSLGQGLSLLFNIHKFINKLKNTNGTKFKNLHRSTFEIINDAAMNYDYYYYRKRFVQTPSIYQRLMYYIKSQSYNLLLKSEFLQKSYKTLNDSIIVPIIDFLEAISNLEQNYKMKDKTQAFTDIFKLIFNILFIAHIVACIALLSVYLELQYSSSQKIWMIQYINEEWYIRYFNSLYWSVVTMITLGYGDIVPITMVEKILVTFIGLVGCLVLSYSMNQFGLILNDLHRKKKEFKQKMIYLNQYLSNRNLEKNIQQHVLKYYNYVYNQQEFNNLEGNTLLNQLPMSLKEEVLINLYSDLINSKIIFSQNFSKQFLTKLMLKMKEKIISPQEPLYNQGDQPDELYFLLNGQSKITLFQDQQKQQINTFKVQIFLKTSEKDKLDPICFIQKKGELIGEFEFFSSFQRQWSAKAINVTCVAYITKQDFLQTIQDFPYDREKFKMIQDDYVFNKRNNFFSCYGCQKTDHTLNECIQVFYHAPKQRIIKSVQLNLPQIRLKSKRKSNKSYKALLIQKYSEQICLLYQQSLAIQQSAAKLSVVFDAPIKNFGTQVSQQQDSHNMQLGVSIEKNKKGNLQKLELAQQKITKVPIVYNESQNTNQSLQHPDSLQVSSSFLPFDVSAPASATFNQKERKKSLLNRTFDDQANSQSTICRERKSILVNKKPDSLEDSNNQIKESLQNRQQYSKKFSQFSQLERQYTNEGNKSREEEACNKSQDNQTENVKSNSSNDDISVFTPELQDGNQQVQIILNNPKIKVRSQSISSFAHQSLQRIKTIDNNEEYNSNYPFHQNSNNQIGQSLFIIDNFDRGNDFEIYFPNYNKTQMIVSANIKRNFDALQNIKRRKRKTKLIETQEKIKKIQNKYRQQKINSIKFY